MQGVGLPKRICLFRKGTQYSHMFFLDITKPRNNETAIFFQLFFLNAETHKETNSADIGSVENFVASAKRVSRRGCLDMQSIH